MDSSEKKIYRFEDVEVDVSSNCLTCDNREIHLRQKSFQVLTYLLKNRERLISKEELMKSIWNDTAVTDDALVQCVKEIRRALGDDSHNPHFIKTVPKAGYRFISPVESFPCESNSDQTEDITRIELEYEEEIDSYEAKNSRELIPLNSAHTKFNRAILTLGIIAAVISFTGLSAYLIPKFLSAGTQTSDTFLPQIAGKTSLAVMYFENQTKNTELEWLREGLADMLITNLSRSTKLTILSRGQLHTILERNNYRSNDPISSANALEFARQAKAEIVITGSFARIGEKIRINVQILNSRNGSIFATENLTVEKPEQILRGIDLLSIKLARHLGIEEKSNQIKFADVMTDDLEAFRYYSLALEKAQGLHNKEAVELFEKAVALDPKFAMAHARIGYTYTVSWGQSEKGKPYLEKAFKLSERLNEKDRLCITAWYAIANHDYSSAIKTYKKIISEYPLETESYWRLGRLLAGEERMNEAVEILEQGLIIDSNDKDIYNTLGGIYSETGRHNEAIAARQRYVEISPMEANAYDSLGLAYQWSGDYDSAIATYKRSLELDPDFEIALVHLANARFQTGQYTEAINLLRRYIEIAPSDKEKARGWEYIAQIYLKKHDYDSAEKASNNVLKIDREWAFSRIFIASVKGDFKRAKKIKDEIFFQPANDNRGARVNSRFGFYYKGLIALKNGQSEEAIADFKAAVRQKPPIWNIDAHEDCLANAYLKLGRFDEAIAEYERILRLNPNYPLVHFHLAQAFQEKGMNEKAKASYRKFLEIWKYADPDIPEILISKRSV